MIHRNWLRACMAGILTLAAQLAHAQSEVVWRTIAPDLETTIVSTGPLGANLVVVRSGLRDYRVGVVESSSFGAPRASVRRLVETSGAILGVNANFFDKDGRALGLVVTEGVVRQRLHGGGRTLTGVFAIGPKGPLIESRIAYSPIGVTEAIQAGPRLVTKGAPTTGLKSSGAASRRAAVCIDGVGRVLFFVVSSSLLGLTFDELQHLLMLPGIDCRDALNLDGGGSAQLYVMPGAVPGGLKTAEIFVPGADEIPVILALLPRK